MILEPRHKIFKGQYKITMISFACLRVYLRTRGYGTPVSIPVHTSYINV
jgi:hypothetical protein